MECQSKNWHQWPLQILLKPSDTFICGFRMRKAQIITHKVWSRNKNLGRDLHRWCWSWRGLYLFNTNSRLQQSELSLSLYLCVLEAVFDGLKIRVCSLAKSICLGGMASFHCKQRVLFQIFIKWIMSHSRWLLHLLLKGLFNPNCWNFHYKMKILTNLSTKRI